MVMLFQPLLANALIYVDDIILFLKDEESHAKLLIEFYNLVKSQGIMLSEKKMVIGQSSIDFLGVNISDGKYTLQPHIASSLGEFPDKLTNTKQIQQFLGIVNYMSDFIPKVSRYRNYFGSVVEEISPRMELYSYRSGPTIEKVIRKTSSLTDSRTRQTDFVDRCK